MNPSDSPAPKSRLLPARRLAMLGGVAGLGAAVLFTAPGFVPQGSLPGAAYAQNLTEQARKLPQPIGFADIVEKVKPAVISVRVRVENNPRLSLNRDNPFPQGSPMDRFFRRFGQPDGIPGVPNEPRSRGNQGGNQGRNFTTGQGSGFFITADGYAVTNNHVV